MSPQSCVIAYMEAQSTSSIGASFSKLGDPLPHPARILRIVNDFSATIILSTDGITNHDYIRAMSEITYDVGTNRGDEAAEFVFPEGTQFWVAAPAGTGTVALVALYARS